LAKRSQQINREKREEREDKVLYGQRLMWIGGLGWVFLVVLVHGQGNSSHLSPIVQSPSMNPSKLQFPKLASRDHRMKMNVAHALFKSIDKAAAN
jgi:hypothetical protein